MKIRKPKYSLKQFRKKNFKHHRVLADFTEKEYTEYQTQRSKIFGYRKQETKLKNKKIRSINKKFVNPEIIEQKTNLVYDKYYDKTEQFYNPLRFTGIVKKHKYSQKMIIDVGNKLIGETIDNLPNKKLREFVKYSNKKGLGGYVQLKLKYISISGVEIWVSKTSYPQQEIDIQLLIDMINFLDEEVSDSDTFTQSPIDAEEKVFYQFVYSLPL